MGPYSLKFARLVVDREMNHEYYLFVAINVSNVIVNEDE